MISTPHINELCRLMEVGLALTPADATKINEYYEANKEEILKESRLLGPKEEGSYADWAKAQNATGREKRDDLYNL